MTQFDYFQQAMKPVLKIYHDRLFKLKELLRFKVTKNAKIWNLDSTRTPYAHTHHTLSHTSHTHTHTPHTHTHTISAYLRWHGNRRRLLPAASKHIIASRRNLHTTRRRYIRIKNIWLLCWNQVFSVWWNCSNRCWSIIKEVLNTYKSIKSVEFQEPFSQFIPLRELGDRFKATNIGTMVY